MIESEKIPVWIRTISPDGTTEGHDEKWDKSVLIGATLTDLGELTLPDGRIVNFYAGNDGEIGYTLEIDNSDPALIARLKKEREERDAEYYRQHPEEDPSNLPRAPNCRCFAVYKPEAP